MPKSSSDKKLSVVVPTYEEALNIRPLCERVFKACSDADLDAELLIVDDDSGDGTVETEKIVAKLAKEGYAIRVHVRRRGEGKGLSSAVVLGLQLAKHENLIVMDADLQHEPESVPKVAAPILNSSADFSVGSRNVGGGVVEDWPFHRKVISWVATALALPLANCSDPMSGFFSLKKTTFLKGADSLNPMGYKIGLELMVRCRCKKIVEVPIRFRDREAGESKLTMKQNVLYLRHLFHLYAFKFPVLLALLALAALYVVYVAARYA